jgi:hypothetical protein
MRTRATLGLALLGVGVIVLAGCAAPAGPGNGSPTGSGTLPRPAAAGAVLAQAVVLQKDGGTPELCLGGVAESYPPQCGGPPVAGWDWAAVEGSETASGVTWGSYAVTGTWDAARFTVTGTPVPLSLFDPAARIDPRSDPANPGPGDEATLLRLQEELHAAAYNPPVYDHWSDSAVLSDWTENGHLWITVIYDDGTVQDFFDAKWGKGIVAVQSALQSVD